MIVGQRGRHDQPRRSVALPQDSTFVASVTPAPRIRWRRALVIGIERATKLLGLLSLTTKAYEATIRLGASTTTDDREGEIFETLGTLNRF